MKNDIAMDVFGDGWEVVSSQNRGEFNYGANDRHFYAMMNGAVLITEYSRYMNENFINGQDLFTYDWHQGEKQVQVIK